VGGGLVIDGKIYHGAPPGDAEIGHVRLDRAGATVESRCSGWAVDAKIRAAAANSDTPLARSARTVCRGEAKFLAPALSQQDPLAKAVLDETANDLAFGLSHVTHLFHPQMIVLGGGLAFVGEPLRAAVEHFLRKYTMEAFAPGPRIALTKLAADAVPTGALTLALARQGH
jgi:glucokinase